MPSFADVSIVILARNGLLFTRHCLESLLRASVLPRQVLVVDNDSSDETPAYLAEQLPRLSAAGIAVVTWRNSENVGCSAARNAAWERATCPYVVFMDNDTAVCTPDWLARLVAEFAGDPRLGIVGPKLIYPFAPHPIQCAGVGINPLGRIRFRGRGRPRHDPEYAQPAVVPALISACWMMRGSFLAELGGLDPLFHPVQYEDLDYCVRVTQAGYRCRYTPAVEMYHFEGRTTGAGGKEQYVRVIAANSLKFRQKWHQVLAALPPDPADYRWCPDAELGLTDTLDLSLVPGP